MCPLKLTRPEGLAQNIQNYVKERTIAKMTLPSKAIIYIDREIMSFTDKKNITKNIKWTSLRRDDPKYE